MKMYIILENDNFLMFFFKKSYWCCFVEIIKEVIVSKFILIYIIEVVYIVFNYICGFLGF